MSLYLYFVVHPALAMVTVMLASLVVAAKA